jgi:hypothetical protein
MFAVQLTCCGRDDGLPTFEMWADADSFRESYLSGAGVDDGGHARSAIIVPQGAWPEHSREPLFPMLSDSR